MSVCVWVWMYIREMLNVLMNAVKNIYSICVMACDAIKFIPTRTSRVMASQGGSRRKRAEGKEMPARSSGEQARGKKKGGCLEKHFQAAAASCKT